MNLNRRAIWFDNGQSRLPTVCCALRLLPFVLLFCSGCVTGPKYVRVEHSDSASIEGPVMPVQGPEDGTSLVNITQIDGLAVSFTASNVGLNWPVYIGTKPLYMAPGQHLIGLKVGENDDNMGNIGGGRTGVVGTYSAAGKSTVTATFLANHVYRFTGELDPASGMIGVYLWDETGGAATRSLVADWTADGHGGYSENAVTSGRNR